LPTYKESKKDDTKSLRGPGYYETAIKWEESKRQTFRKLTQNNNKSCDFSSRNAPGPGHYNIPKRILYRKGKFTYSP
jgi:hypothetical protein